MVSEIQSISASGRLRDKLRTVPCVGSLHTVHGFGQPCPVAAVGVVDPSADFPQCSQLPPCPPGKNRAVPPAEGVANLVVGDGRAVEGGQQVLPHGRGIAVGVQGSAVFGGFQDKRL